MPVSWVYGLLTSAHRWLYCHGWKQVERLPVPVVVVGNVVVGGGGKTPTVMALVRHLQRTGRHPGVISRGYGRRTDECLEVFAHSHPGEVGDEPLLIQRSTAVPVFVARRRIDAGRAALTKHPEIDVLVCDDGLQHLALHRDLEICVFDERGTGNGFLLPSGPLRESGPRRADLILHTGARRAFNSGFGAIRRLADHGFTSSGERVDLASQRRLPLLAVAGIATPENFFGMLREKGLPIQAVVPLPDHWDYSQWDVTTYQGWQILCTEKDAVKLWRIVPDAIAVPLDFTPEPAFFREFDQWLFEQSIYSATRRA
jgi:tetraacyldisaccharide 4'-kinase